VGASLLIAVPELFRFLTDYRMILYGLILIVMMLFRREGLFRKRTYALRVTPPWERKGTSPVYATGDKFLKNLPLKDSADGTPKD